MRNKRKLSEEHKRKIGEAHKGIKRGPMSEEQKKKISLTLTGFSHSKEMKKKMSDIKLKYPNKYWLGKNRSNETKQKMSEKHWKGGCYTFYHNQAREVMGLLGPGKYGITRYGIEQSRAYRSAS